VWEVRRVLGGKEGVKGEQNVHIASHVLRDIRPEPVGEGSKSLSVVCGRRKGRRGDEHRSVGKLERAISAGEFLHEFDTSVVVEFTS
jgi:hypothetical protein